LEWLLVFLRRKKVVYFFAENLPAGKGMGGKAFYLNKGGVYKCSSLLRRAGSPADRCAFYSPTTQTIFFD
jgi:hypothetical protein